VTEIIKKVGDLKDSRSPFANFFLFGLEVAQSVLWITSTMPGPTAESFIETSQFYGNKILREKQENQVNWVKSLNDLVRSNLNFVKENFSAGIL
jgi:Adenylate cyclase associated (CAP) N terminal.